MSQLADRLEMAAEVLRGVDRAVPHLAVPPSAFGADPTTGEPGRLGHELHARWTAALEARSREAFAAAARVTALASAVRDTASAYVETDAAVAGRIERTG
jgi:hypothetical protein